MERYLLNYLFSLRASSNMICKNCPGTKSIFSAKTNLKLSTLSVLFTRPINRALTSFIKLFLSYRICCAKAFCQPSRSFNGLMLVPVGTLNLSSRNSISSSMFIASKSNLEASVTTSFFKTIAPHNHIFSPELS